MPATTARPDGDPLSEYILQEFLTKWRKNREPLQRRWERNLDNYLSISPASWKKNEGQNWRSKTYIHLTKNKVMSAWALMIDMILQGGAVPFLLKPSEMMRQFAQQAGPEYQQAMQEALDNMTAKIHDQCAAANADRMVMRAILSGAIYGEAYGKMIVIPQRNTQFRPDIPPEVNSFVGIPYDAIGWTYGAVMEDIVGLECPSTWDIFRDLETDDLQAGQGVIHRRLISQYALRQKKGKPFFNDTSIDAALKASKPGGSSEHGETDTESLSPRIRNLEHRHSTINHVEFWGRIPQTELENYQRHMQDAKLTKVEDPDPDSLIGKEVEIMCCVSEGYTTRFADRTAGNRPFFRFVWEDCLDEIGGFGIADNVADDQIVVNGAVRAAEDNAKLAANVILAIQERYFENMPKDLEPGTILRLRAECKDASQAMQQVIISPVIEPLMALIELFSGRFAEEDSMVPRVVQGMQSNNEQTATEVMERVAQAGKYMGAVVRNFDEGIIEPLINALYRWNMDDEEYDGGRGDFVVQAMGFSSYQRRIERTNQIRMLLSLASQPPFDREIKFRKALEALVKAMGEDLDEFLKSEEEKQQEMEQAQNDPMLRLELADKQSAIARNQADASRSMAETEAIPERLKIDRAKAVSDMTGKIKDNAPEKPVEPTAQPVPEV